MDLAGLYRHLPALERAIGTSYGRARVAAPPAVRTYLDINREFTLRGGKRFRAILVLAGYHLATGRSPGPALSAAAGLEHFQSWMLVHDDIIDHAEERRGGPTVHRALARSYVRDRGESGSDAYGTGMAITLGDLEEPFTVEAILSSRVKAPARLAALAEYVRMTRLTAYGQILDIRNGTLAPDSVTEEDVLTVHRLKSAMYTVVAPLKIGSLLGGSPPSQLRDLEAIGERIGVAFQLRDDVLGAGFGTGVSGKSSNDLVEGKRTLLVVRAWARGTEDDRRQLDRVLGNEGASRNEIDRALHVIRATGSLDYSERRIDQLLRGALRRLERSRTIRAEGKPLLREIADRLTRREA